MKFLPLPLAPGPIFCLQANDANLYYAPGYLLRVSKNSVRQVEEQILNSRYDFEDVAVATLLDHATRAREYWKDLVERPYRPQSLHLYLNRRCQLACQYCFSDLTEFRDPAEISVSAAYAAANLVAENCARQGLPLVMVFHGGGEPVLSWRLIDKLQPELRRVAEGHGIPLFRYIATNGVMTEQRANWLASSFDLVGFSVDGPPDIQSVQRPSRGLKKNSTSVVLRTASILRESGVPIHVRVTLTADSALRQVEICRYLCESISPQVINVEPVYLGGRADASMLIKEEQLDCFIKSFFEARVEARMHGVEWKISGARLAQVHGPYCNIFRQVLQMAPDDIASACFKDISAAQASKYGRAIVYFDGAIKIDDEQIRSLRTAFIRPQICETCFLGYHCTYNCPNACLLNKESTTDILCKLLKSIFSLHLIHLGNELSHISGKIVGMEIASD